MSTAAESAPAIGFCRDCGYSLQGLTTHRCPECGRAFDPADPKTMNMGRRAGRLARWLCRPIRWRWLIAFFCLATLAVVSTSRPQAGPVQTWDLTPIDVLPYLSARALRPIWYPGWQQAIQKKTVVDYSYAAGLWMWIAGLTAILLKLPLQKVVSKLYSLPPRPVRLSATGFHVVAILLLITVTCTLVGWPFRIAQNMAANHIAFMANMSKSSSPTQLLLNEMTPTFHFREWGSTDPRRAVVLRAIIEQSPSARQRIAGLGICSLIDPEKLPTILPYAIDRETDPSVLEWELRLIGLLHDSATPLIAERFINSPDLRLRIASLDAVTASVESPVISPDFAGNFHALPTDPVIPLPDFFANVPKERIQYRSAMEDLIADRMATASELSERESAGRAYQAIVASRPTGPPSPALFRLAEWGVWVDAGALASADQLLGDIPPFVHQFGESAATLAREKDLVVPYIITKPVLDFSTDRTLSVSLKIEVSRGRITYAFPKPDDYSLGGSQFANWGRRSSTQQVQPLARFDAAPDVAPFKDRRTQLPWLIRTTAAGDAPFLVPQSGYDFRVRNPPELSTVGFRWDALLITPQRQPWMQLPQVPNDPRFSWWTRLRDVPCAWVSSRGESERFLYYDGPSLQSPKVRVRLQDSSHLRIEAPIGEESREEDRVDVASSTSLDGMKQSARAGRRGERRGMYIEVTDQVTEGEAVPLPKGIQPPAEPLYPLTKNQQLDAKQLESTLRDWLIDAGLTAAEADGLLACWRETFFHKPGKRFVMLMSAVDYDSLCPINIRPAPQTLARVGLVWTEFERNQQPATKPAE